MVYDVTCAKSFESLPTWKAEFLRQCNTHPEKLPFIVIGNKCELENERQVQTGKAQLWCKQNEEMPLFEVSAKDRTNVDAAFETAAKLAFEHHSSSLYRRA